MVRPTSDGAAEDGSQNAWRGARAAATVLAGYAATINLDEELLGRPGTTVVSTPDRAGGGAVAAYRLGRHLVLWCDPAVERRLARLAGPDEPPDAVALSARLRRAGFGPGHGARVRVLTGRPTPPADPPGGLVVDRLDAATADGLAVVRALVERCGPDDAEAVDLDDLDGGLEDTNVHVLRADGPAGPAVAYGSAIPWEHDPAVGDVGVLVDPDHRGLGLARHVVALVLADVVSEGRTPVYRHDDDNVGSAAVADALGLVDAATLSYHVLADHG